MIKSQCVCIVGSVTVDTEELVTPLSVSWNGNRSSHLPYALDGSDHYSLTDLPVTVIVELPMEQAERTLTTP